MNGENALMSPIELMAATDTVYSALGIKPRSTTLVFGLYSVGFISVHCGVVVTGTFQLVPHTVVANHIITHGLRSHPRHHS